MAELKPCPFCGGEADYRKSRINSQDVVYVHCKNCNARTNLVFLDKPHWHIGEPINRYTVQEAKDIAMELWNRRADNE